MSTFSAFKFLLICAQLIGAIWGSPTEKETQLGQLNEQEFQKVPYDNAQMFPELNSLCESIKRVIYPKKAKTVNGEWHFIVQTEEHKQGVVEEVCMNANGACAFSENFPRGYVAKCIQTYDARPMIAIVNGTVVKENFTIRSGCKCMLEKKDYLNK